MDQSKIDALLQKYHSWQSEIWLNIPDGIEDIKVLNMNLKHLLILDGLDSPLLKGGNITDTDALLFLWVVSSDFCYNEKARDKFFKKANKINTLELVAWIEEYLKKSFAESDTMKGNAKAQTYFITYFIDCFAREYGWKIDEIISYVSQYFTLKIGDLIFTGTPSGVSKVISGDFLEGFINSKKMFSQKIK